MAMNISNVKLIYYEFLNLGTVIEEAGQRNGM